MTFENIKATLGKELSALSTTRVVLMRNGKYTSGMNYSDAYSSMIFETIMELEESEDYAPLTKSKVRELIKSFNKLTASNVPDVWETII